ncbi:MAG: type II toxin-antitoxin system death-on-curing family toxin [Crinalium sp.]
MKQPIWLSEQIVKAIQIDQLTQHGGMEGIRDENLLSASLARPIHFFNYANPCLFELAAAYGFGITKNHPFVDGNKRTAFMVMYVFLGLNNYKLEMPDSEVILMMERLASGEESQESLASWLENYAISSV